MAMRGQSCAGRSCSAPGSAPSQAGAFRVLSGTTQVGEQILWSFDNATFATDPPVSHPSTALSTLDAPLELSDLVDGHGLPRPSVQRLPEDDPAIYTFDPGSVVATSEHAALLFFQRVAYLTPVGVGVVHVDAEGGGVREPALLFESPDPLFFVAGFVDDGFLYLYSSEPRENDANSPLGAVVRAPVLEAARRGSYRAWSADAQGWVADLQQRTAVLSRAPRLLRAAARRARQRVCSAHRALVHAAGRAHADDDRSDHQRRRDAAARGRAGIVVREKNRRLSSPAGGASRRSCGGARDGSHRTCARHEMRGTPSLLPKQEVMMKQLAVFPSNAVARWIDAELIEREREALREQGALREDARQRSPDIRVVGRLYLSRRAGLRYRPFEQLSSLYLQHAS